MKQVIKTLQDYSMLVVAGISIVTVIVTLAGVDVSQSTQIKANTEAILKNTLLIDKLSNEKLDKDEYYRFEQIQTENVNDMQKQIEIIQDRILGGK